MPKLLCKSFKIIPNESRAKRVDLITVNLPILAIGETLVSCEHADVEMPDLRMTEGGTITFTTTQSPISLILRVPSCDYDFTFEKGRQTDVQIALGVSDIP